MATGPPAKVDPAPLKKMKTYKLFFVNPDNASAHFGEPVDTDIRPRNDDTHTINGKAYIVTDIRDITTTGRSGAPYHMDIRLKEVVAPEVRRKVKAEVF